MVQIGSFEEGKDLVVGVRLPPPGNIYQDWMRLFVALCAEFACLQHHATSGKHLMPGFYAGYTSFDSVGREMGMARRMTLKLRAEYSDDYMRKLTQELSVKGVMLLRWRKPQQFNPRRYTRINMAHISQQCEVEILASDIALGEMVESGLVLGVEQKPYYYTPLLAKREEAISIRRKAALDAFLVERGLRTKKAGGVPKRATAQAVADEIQAKADIILMAHGQRLQEAETAKAIFPQVNIDVDQEQAPAAAVKAKAGEESAALAQRVAKEKAAKEKASAEEAARVKKEQAKVGAHVSKKKEETKPSEAARVENEEIGRGGKKPANVAQDEAANTTVAAQTGAEGAPAEIATMRKDVGAPAPAPAATSAQPQRVNKVSRAPQRRQPATDASTDADAKVEGRVSESGIVAPDDDDAAQNLAADTESRQKRMLGESLYPLVYEMHPKLGGKITGMLLEMDNSDLLHLLEDVTALKVKVGEAFEVLREACKPSTAEPAPSTTQPHGPPLIPDPPQDTGGAVSAVSGLDPTPAEQQERERSIHRVKEELAQRLIPFFDAAQELRRFGLNEGAFDKTSLATALAVAIVSRHPKLDCVPADDVLLQPMFDEFMTSWATRKPNSPPRPSQQPTTTLATDDARCEVCKDMGSFLQGGTHIMLRQCAQCSKCVHYSKKKARGGKYCSYEREGELICTLCSGTPEGEVPPTTQ
jgi:polyadenylate-binding protein